MAFGQVSSQQVSSELGVRELLLQGTGWVNALSTLWRWIKASQKRVCTLWESVEERGQNIHEVCANFTDWHFQQKSSRSLSPKHLVVPREVATPAYFGTELTARRSPYPVSSREWQDPWKQGELEEQSSQTKLLYKTPEGIRSVKLPAKVRNSRKSPSRSPLACFWFGHPSLNEALEISIPPLF